MEEDSPCRDQHAPELEPVATFEGTEDRNGDFEDIVTRHGENRCKQHGHGARETLMRLVWPAMLRADQIDEQG